MFYRACLEIFIIVILGSCMPLSHRLRDIDSGVLGERKHKVRRDKERSDELIMTALARRNVKQVLKGCLGKLLSTSFFVWRMARDLRTLVVRRAKWVAERVALAY